MQTETHHRRMDHKIDVLMMFILWVSGSKFLAGLGSLVVIIYYLSMLKVNVIDKFHSKSWKNYVKSFFKKK